MSLLLRFPACSVVTYRVAMPANGRRRGMKIKEQREARGWTQATRHEGPRRERHQWTHRDRPQPAVVRAGAAREDLRGDAGRVAR